MKEVTIKWLREKNACRYQVELFKQTFGESVALTKRNILKAQREGLALDWFARTYLSLAAWKAYKGEKAIAWEAYEKVVFAAWEAYEKVVFAAWKAYKGEKAIAWEAYKGEKAIAWEAYKEAKAAAWKAYKEAKAAALWEAIKMEKVK